MKQAQVLLIGGPGHGRRVAFVGREVHVPYPLIEPEFYLEGEPVPITHFKVAIYTWKASLNRNGYVGVHEGRDKIW